MTATQKQIRSYLNESSRDLQARFDRGLATMSNVTLDATESIAAEAALVLWAAFNKAPHGIVTRDGRRVIECRPCGELGPVFTVVCAMQPGGVVQPPVIRGDS